ncbi:MAG: M20/M25/M40 family metallo-hydrolase [Halioglobus sp.]
MWAPLANADAWLNSAQTASAVEQLLEEAQKDNQAYDILTSLTTEVGPRLAGSEAEARARDWAVQKMQSLGLANVRIEPFTVPLWVRGIERAEITSPFPQPLVITALGGSVSTGPDGIEAEVVSFPNLEALKKASPDQVGGRIVFVDEVMARSRDGSGYSAAVGKRYQATHLTERLGGRAALIRSVGTNSHRFAHTGHMGSVEDGASRGVPSAALSAPDADQLQRALGYGKTVKVKMTVTPQLRPPSPSGNVVGEIVGSESPQEIVLVAAHLDSWDLGTGAVDDGAGVGIVLGAVAALQKFSPKPPRRTIRIVLFGAEEVGLIGAKAYAQKHAGEVGNHIIGTESDFGAGDIWRLDTRFGKGKETLANAVAQHFAPLNISLGNNEATGGPDMKHLREAGMPVVTLLQDGSDYFDLHHTPNDTLDKVPPNALDQNVAAYAAFLYLVANASVEFR